MNIVILSANEHSPSFFSVTVSNPKHTAVSLIGAAFVDYARLLRSLGLREGAALWASRAGGPGEQLMEELFQGEGEGTPEGLTPADQETGPGDEGDEDRKFAIVEG
ncbi:unnamed protein product [Boreogadus saida]